jgi:hypothetical protein
LKSETTYNGGMTRHELITPMSCRKVVSERYKAPQRTHISKQETTTTGKDEEQDNPEVGLGHCCELFLELLKSSWLMVEALIART